MLPLQLDLPDSNPSAFHIDFFNKLIFYCMINYFIPLLEFTGSSMASISILSSSSKISVIPCSSLLGPCFCKLKTVLFWSDLYKIDSIYFDQNNYISDYTNMIWLKLTCQHSSWTFHLEYLEPPLAYSCFYFSPLRL